MPSAFRRPWWVRLRLDKVRVWFVMRWRNHPLRVFRRLRETERSQATIINEISRIRQEFDRISIDTSLVEDLERRWQETADQRRDELAELEFKAEAAEAAAKAAVTRCESILRWGRMVRHEVRQAELPTSTPRELTKRLDEHEKRQSAWSMEMANRVIRSEGRLDKVESKLESQRVRLSELKRACTPPKKKAAKRPR